MERTSLRTKGRRWLARVAIALAAVYALYLVAGHVFLNTALGEKALNRKPDRFQMHWTSGPTGWPGRVDLRGVRLQGQSRRIVWRLPQ